MMPSRVELRGKSPGVVPHTVQAGLQTTADEKNFQNLRTRVQTGMENTLRGLGLTSNKGGPKSIRNAALPYFEDTP